MAEKRPLTPEERAEALAPLRRADEGPGWKLSTPGYTTYFAGEEEARSRAAEVRAPIAAAIADAVRDAFRQALAADPPVGEEREAEIRRMEPLAVPAVSDLLALVDYWRGLCAALAREQGVAGLERAAFHRGAEAVREECIQRAEAVVDRLMPGIPWTAGQNVVLALKKLEVPS
jgi:hypothetical protein